MKDKAFSLEFHCEGERIYVRGNERTGQEVPTLKHVEKLALSLPEAKKHTRYINDLVNYAAEHGHLSNSDVSKLKEKSRLLFDELIPPAIKTNLTSDKWQTLILSLDDHLVGIPWELLYDGESFLSLRFNMGRVVSTRHAFSQTKQDLSLPLKMLLLVDPQNNLPSSKAEGLKLRDMLDEKLALINVSYVASAITTNFVKEKLRFFDILHYAGHAEYDNVDPALSGLLLQDGKLTAQNIKNLTERMIFPSFVFLNGCQSGQTKEWKISKGYEQSYGLANAFLLAGVRHYLGTFWKIEDDPGSMFSQEFYRNLLAGDMIGQAVRKARCKLADALGEGNIIWASYMLYGDPIIRYIKSDKEEDLAEQEIKPITPASRDHSTLTQRGGKNPFSSSPYFRSSWANFGIACAGLALLTFIIFSIIRSSEKNQLTSPKYAENSSESSAEMYFRKAKRIDGQIKALARKFHDGTLPSDDTPPSWNSIPIPLVFLNMAREGGISETEARFMVSKIIDHLKGSKRIRVVERSILEKLLDELQLSASELADQATALKLGKVLSARLIADSSVLRMEDNWIVDVKIFDTESTIIAAAIPVDAKTDDISKVAEEVGEKILLKIKAAYPLQGEITKVDGTLATINLGTDLGLEERMVFEILSHDGTVIGSMETSSMKKKETQAAIIAHTHEIMTGHRIRETVQ